MQQLQHGKFHPKGWQELREGLKPNFGILEVWEGEGSFASSSCFRRIFGYFPSGDAPSCPGASPGMQIVPCAIFGDVQGVLEGNQSLRRELWCLGSPPAPAPALLPENSHRELGWRDLQVSHTGPVTPPEGREDREDSRGGIPAPPG